MPDILIATDSEALYQEISAVLASPETTVRWARTGPDVRTEMNREPADLAIVDMQIGTMGGVAVALDLHLESDAGRLVRRPVLLILDRRPDVFMARRARVDGWVIKPLDPIRIRRATTALLDGGTYFDDSFRPEPVR